MFDSSMPGPPLFKAIVFFGSNIKCSDDTGCQRGKEENLCVYLVHFVHISPLVAFSVFLLRSGLSIVDR